MAVIQIQMNKPNHPVKGLALFNLGFRPFFLGAGIFAVISILWWMLIYSSHGFVQIEAISKSQWHAHEMLYGYGLAVVAGFLLTAVKNWTGVQTLYGKSLMALFALWCAARVLFLFGTSLLLWAAIADLLFGLVLVWAITMPIVKAKQWMQLGVLVKVLLLWAGNLVFYLGCYGVLEHGMLYAINGAVLLFIGLILMIGRRVMPFFIERGVQEKVQLKQYKWLDISIMLCFVAWFANELFFRIGSLSAYLALVLFLANGYRLKNWYTKGIWKVPLLWSLYVAACLINVGFLAYGLQSQFGISSILTLHLFTIGGIGLMTINMMARVALGHTGRDIRKPSSLLAFIFLAMCLSVASRVLMPILSPQYYADWVLVSGFFWIIAFAGFVAIYAPVLLRPRVDGMFG